MNLAVPALLLLLLLLPGLLAASAYLGRFGRGRSEPVADTTFTWSWFWALLASPPLHLVWMTAIGFFSTPQPAIAAVFSLLSGVGERQEKVLTEAVSPFGLEIFCYFFSISVVAALLGGMARKVVRTLGLDLTFKSFRFGNRWHYRMSGEQQAIDMIDDIDAAGLPMWQNISLKRQAFRQWRNAQRPLVTISVTLSHAADDYLYVRFLQEYEIDTNGGLLSLRLIATIRRKLTDDRSSDEAERKPLHDDPRFYEITGDSVCIWARDVKSLSIRETLKNRS